MSRNSRPLAGRLVRRAPDAQDLERAEKAAARLSALAPKRWTPPAEREA